MKLLRGLLISTAAVAGAGYVVYRFVLNDEARQGLRDMASAMEESYQRINDVVEDITGIVIEEDAVDLPNRAATLRQWAGLGY